MWVAASTTAALATAFVQTGSILVAVVAPVLGGLIALLGLGYGISRLKHYIFDEHGFMMSGGMYDREGGKYNARW